MTSYRKSKAQRTVKMEVDEILERMTRAEERMVAASQRAEEWHAAAASATDKIEERIEKLERALARYNGFWGAIVLITTAVGSALMLFKEFIFDRMGGGHS